MDFEQTRKKLLQLAKEWAETDGENMAAVEDIEIAASVTLLEYCVANNEQIAGLDLRKLLELDEDSEDYEDNVNARHEFISQVYYKDDTIYTAKNISEKVQQLAACFYDYISEEN